MLPIRQVWGEKEPRSRQIGEHKSTAREVVPSRRYGLPWYVLEPARFRRDGSGITNPHKIIISLLEARGDGAHRDGGGAHSAQHRGGRRKQGRARECRALPEACTPPSGNRSTLLEQQPWTHYKTLEGRGSQDWSPDEARQQQVVGALPPHDALVGKIWRHFLVHVLVA